MPPKLDMPCRVFAGERDGYDPGIVENVGRMPNAGFVPFPNLTLGRLFFSVDLVLPKLQRFLACQATA